MDRNKKGKLTKKAIIEALKRAASMILDDNAAEYFAMLIEMYGDKRTI